MHRDPIPGLFVYSPRAREARACAAGVHSYVISLHSGPWPATVFQDFRQSCKSWQCTVEFDSSKDETHTPFEMLKMSGNPQPETTCNWDETTNKTIYHLEWEFQFHFSMSNEMGIPTPFERLKWSGDPHSIWGARNGLGISVNLVNPDSARWFPISVRIRHTAPKIKFLGVL